MTTARSIVAQTASTLRAEIAQDRVGTNPTHNGWKNGMQYAVESFESRIKDAEEVPGVFNVNIPCPDCGSDNVFGYSFYNEQGKHMHTHYVCTFWESGKPEGTGRCGWHGWTVPTPKTDTYRVEIKIEGRYFYSGEIESSENPSEIVKPYIKYATSIQRFNEDIEDWVTI